MREENEVQVVIEYQLNPERQNVECLVIDINDFKTMSSEDIAGIHFLPLINRIKLAVSQPKRYVCYDENNQVVATIYKIGTSPTRVHGDISKAVTILEEIQ